MMTLQDLMLRGAPGQRDRAQVLLTMNVPAI
jgi:hypothetical protein